MNDTLAVFARSKLKEDLAKCTKSQQLTFKHMYSFKDVTLPVGQVVDQMPADHLDWAMKQVERTVVENGTDSPSVNLDYQLE